MKPANLALVVGANFASGIIGAFIGGFIGAAMGTVAVGGVLSLVTIPVAGYLVGLWVGKRQDPPSKRELMAGCWAYVVLCIVVAGLSRHPYAVIYALVGGAGLAYLLHRGAVQGMKNLPASTPATP